VFSGETDFGADVSYILYHPNGKLTIPAYYQTFNFVERKPQPLPPTHNIVNGVGTSLWMAILASMMAISLSSSLLARPSGQVMEV